MFRPFLPVLGCLSIASLSMLTGCPAKGDGEASGSASAAAGTTVAPTCKDAAGRYGEHLAEVLVDDPKSTVPANLKDKAKVAIKDAVVQSCEEDKWGDIPLSCLASVFKKPDVLGDKLFDGLMVCADGAGKEKSTKMDDRVALAVLSVEKGGAPTPASAPYVSKDGGYQIDFRGETPVESIKDDPNGGSWHDASLKNGVMAQWTDYSSPAAATVEADMFIPTRDKSQIKRDEKITFKGLSGRDIEMSMRSGKTIWIRFLIDGKRVFKLGMVYGGDKAAATTFMESFVRLGADAAPAGSAAASAEPSAGQPASAQPASGQPASGQPGAKPIAPKPIAPKPIAPKPQPHGDEL